MIAISLGTAKQLLAGAVREECRDHAFGDTEVYWMKDGKEIAQGYFGREASVSFEGCAGSFNGDEARELRELGTLGAVDRNDSTGPDTYVEGQTMPALTREGVLNELRGRL